MHDALATVLAMVLDAGIFGLVIAGLGVLGALAMLATGVAVLRRARATMRLALVTTALGVLAAGVGGAGVLMERAMTDRSISHSDDDLSLAERQRLRREGYLTAQVSAQLGLMVAALPLLAGVAAVFVAARRRARAEALAIDPEFPLPIRPRRGLSLAVTAGAVASSGFALAALLEPVPWPNAEAEETTRSLLDEIADVQRAPDEGEGVFNACRRIEQAIDRRRATLDRWLLPTLPAVAKRCVEARIQHAAVLPSIGAVQRELDDVAASPFVRRDKELQRVVAAAVEEVRQIAAAPPPRDEPASAAR